MADLGNYRLQRTVTPTHHDLPYSRAWRVWGVALLAALLALGVYVWVQRNRPAATTAAAGQAATTVGTDPAPAPLGGNPEAVEVPPLAESDPVVRMLAESMSSHPRVLAWLATDGLIRNFTVVVGNIAEGRTPARHLAVLAPGGRFSATGDGAGFRIDPASYARYNQLAAAVDSVHPQAAARVYATLKPRIEEAQRDLGAPQPFDRTLEEAIVRLVQTPVAIDSRLTPKGAEGYRYVDDGLESMTDAQKLLLRMGPANARIVQDKLRQIGLALGIPAARLGT